MRASEIPPGKLGKRARAPADDADGNLSEHENELVAHGPLHTVFFSDQSDKAGAHSAYIVTMAPSPYVEDNHFGVNLQGPNVIRLHWRSKPLRPGPEIHQHEQHEHVHVDPEGKSASDVPGLMSFLEHARRLGIGRKVLHSIGDMIDHQSHTHEVDVTVHVPLLQDPSAIARCQLPSGIKVFVIPCASVVGAAAVQIE